MLAIDKIGCGPVRVRLGPDEQLAVWGQCASRVGARGIAGDGKSLATAAAPVYFATIAGSAGIGHPVRAAETVEGFGILPDIAQTALAHILKMQTGDGFSGMARQHFA